MADGALSRSEGYFEGKDAHGGADPSRSPTSRHYARLACWIALTDVLAIEVAILLTRYIRLGLRSAGPNFATIMLVAPLVLVRESRVASSPSPKPSSAGPPGQLASLKLLLRQAEPWSEPLSRYFQTAPGVTSETG